MNEYDGESQDELLLLKLSQAGSQFELVKRDQFSITLLYKSTDENIVFPIIRIIAFTSERKMMTIVVNAEEKFDVKIPDDEVKNLTTVGEAVTFITKAQA